jgi:NAD(P)-dependent dehydrogenase (short-subunit alcohol dehydrogenase family)
MKRDKFRFDGRTAVITGAGSGIGRALAVALAARSCHLALADIDEAGLAETVAMVTVPGLRVSQHGLDVASREQVADLPAAVLAVHPGVDLLFNNAGVALGGKFEQLSEADFDWLFEINFHGLVRMTRAFLPVLRQSDEARLVNLSSIFGIIAPPGQSAYAASKFAVRGFSQALERELAGSTVGVTTVHPGGIATSIAANARISAAASDAASIARQRAAIGKILVMPPPAAAEIILGGVENRRARVLVGRDAAFAATLERLLPVSYWRVMRGLMPRRGR